ncbi:hypothetical protein CTI12_AA125230 [Artemisia annua]|uniref:Uncharacterized protein n=1 Tax=Artemisia annua TaxID=35608 RepID=A0A2U1PQJ1_ARTAN|nr:hypothetical protein CTI12_AA125230 [Artemisia annua]
MDEKRRLPSWMVRKPKEEVKDEEEVSVVMECTKPKAKRVARVKDEGLASDGDSFLVKCGTKRKKKEKEVVEKDVIECRDVEEEGGGGEKRKRGRVGRKGGERGVARKKKEKDCELEFDRSDEIQRLSSGEEDEDELTMEDMLMIAKEFVENDKSAKGQQQPSERQCELKKKSSHVFSSMARTSLIAPQDTGTHSIVETASRRDSVENTSEVTLTDFKTTDDPAQDMLDLFLGPLLNKPIRKEETSSTKDVVIPREITSQKHDPVISDKPITFAKKKSSLRDAVAMLLES